MRLAAGAALDVARGEREALGRAALRAQPVALAREQVLPVLPAFETLLPEPGLRRGTVTRIHGPGATSVALALLAGCTMAGSWMAAIGVAGLGLGAALELGVALERLLLVDVPARTAPARGEPEGRRARTAPARGEPEGRRARAAPARGEPEGRRARTAPARGEPEGRRARTAWAGAVAAALDGVDALLVEVPRGVRDADARRIQARLRDRSSVVVVVGTAGAFQPDLVMATGAPVWVGLGDGWGHLQARCLPVEITGRRAAARPRSGRLWLPSSDGEIRLEQPTNVVRLLEEAG